MHQLTLSVVSTDCYADQLSILNGVYGGLGQSLGSLIGGTLQHRFGTSKAFFISAAADVVLLSLFMLYRNWPQLAWWVSFPLQQLRTSAAGLTKQTKNS